MNARPEHVESTSSYYRAYIVGRDGKFEKAIDLQGPNDKAATAQALQLLGGHPVEVWDRSRMLVRLEANELQKMPRRLVIPQP